MDIILLGGLWLRPDAWLPVQEALVELGHRAQSLTLPGQLDSSCSATLQDQIDIVVAAVDDAEGQTLVVGHSAASALAWIAADLRPEKVSAVVMIGGMPVENGKPYANFFPVEDGRMAFPGWEAFAGADSADLDADARQQIERGAISVPEGVCHAVVSLSDERRFTVPVTLVCPEYSPAEAQAWIDEGFAPELRRAREVTLVNIDSGHWPMVSRPRELAGILAEATRHR